MLFDHLAHPTSRLLSLFLTVCLAGVFLIATTYTFLAVPYADDFCRASLGTIGEDWIHHVVRIYHEWSGRWAVHSLYALTFPYINITSTNYNFLIALAVILWLAVFFIFVRLILRERINYYHSMFLAVILCAIYWSGMPNPGQTWYWLTGLVEYGLPFLLSSFVILILTSGWFSSQSSVPRQMLAMAGASSIAFLVTGFNELVGLLLGSAITSAVAVAALRKRYNQAKGNAVVVLIILLGTFVNLLAPGTAVYSAEYPGGHSLSRVLDIGIFNLNTSPLGWFIDIKLLSLAAILLTSPWFLSLQPEWAKWNLPHLPLVIAIPTVLTTAVFGGYFLVAYAEGDAPPPRVLNVLYAVYIAGAFLWMVAVGKYVAGSADASNTLIRGANIVGGVVLSLSLIMSPNMVAGILELRYFSIKWTREVVARDQSIRNEVQQGAREIATDPITFRTPSLFFWSDLESDFRNWRNACVARYYGLDRISVRPGARGGFRGVW